MDDDSQPDGQEPISVGEEPARERDYEVGYGKPPTHSQFKKGNPGGGRPKGSASKPNLLDELERALSTKVTVTENGKRRRRTLRELGGMSLAQKYARGDLAAIKLVYSLTAVEAEAHADLWEEFERDEQGNLMIKLDMGNPKVEERIRQKEVERLVALRLAELGVGTGI